MRTLSWLVVTLAVAVGSSAEAAPGDIVNSWAGIGYFPAGLGWNHGDGTLWVANMATQSEGGLNAMYKHNPDTGAPLDSFPMPDFSIDGGDYYHGLEFSSAGNIVVDDLYRELVVLSTTGEVLSRWSLPSGRKSYGVAVDDQDRVYYLDYLATPKKLYLITAAGADVSSVEVPQLTGMTMDMTWDGSAVWVNTDSEIFRLDPVTGATLATIPAPTTGMQGITWDGRCLWVASEDSNLIYKLEHGQSDLPPCVGDWPVDAGSDGGGGGGGGDAPGGGDSDAGGPGATGSGGGCSGSRASGMVPVLLAALWLAGRRRRVSTTAQ
jgi:DNA-binding beta-propeller fold protein YncE